MRRGQLSGLSARRHLATPPANLLHIHFGQKTVPRREQVRCGAVVSGAVFDARPVARNGVVFLAAAMVQVGGGYTAVRWLIGVAVARRGTMAAVFSAALWARSGRTLV
jgi:hypothetical protein